MNQSLFSQYLGDAEVAELRACGRSLSAAVGELIFAEGDAVGEFYIIESGEVEIFVEKAGKRQPVNRLGAGDYFGEMAIFDQGERTASAAALGEVALLSIDRECFLAFLGRHPALAEHMAVRLAERREELVLRESLIDCTGLDDQRLSLSIKGDPSLRESAFSRERYQSVVDKVLPTLQLRLQEVLLERSVYRLFINFGSGEIRTSSVFDPFVEELHTADKMARRSYVARHFPAISYAEKSAMIRGIYGYIERDSHYAELPAMWNKILGVSHGKWNPVPEPELVKVIAQLAQLRSIPNFYLRNINISMVRDVIRMQFNCDGTHLVSSRGYQQFLEDNLV